MFFLFVCFFFKHVKWMITQPGQLPGQLPGQWTAEKLLHIWPFHLRTAAEKQQCW